ncbi:transposase [Umezawaea sp.]|uniref:transposase n=1 Tax=Umezawaea sp. TaxID=1955258 RepID=UPI002ECFBF33
MTARFCPIAELTPARSIVVVTGSQTGDWRWGLSSQWVWPICFDLGFVRRHGSTDEQRQTIEPLPPVSGAQGRPRADDRRVINGTLFKATTGVAWRDLPQHHRPGRRSVPRVRRWSRNGTLTTLAGEVRVITEAIGELDREVSVDAGIVRAHQHTSTPPTPAAPAPPRPPPGAAGSCVVDQARLMGRLPKSRTGEPATPRSLISGSAASVAR